MDVSHHDGSSPLKYMGFYLFPQDINEPARCVPCWHAGVGTTFAPPYVVTFPTKERELGFSIAGGSDVRHGWRPFYINSITPGGMAAQMTQLNEGDEVLGVNGSLLYGLTHCEAVSLFQQLGNGPLQLTLRHPLPVSSTPCSAAMTPGEHRPVSVTSSFTTAPTTPRTHDLTAHTTLPETLGITSPTLSMNALHDQGVVLWKTIIKKETGVDLGLDITCLKLPDGRQGIFVQKVRPVSATTQSHSISLGDQILEIGGERLENVSLLEAQQILARLPPGPVMVVLLKRAYQLLHGNERDLLLKEAGFTDADDEWDEEDEAHKNNNEGTKSQTDRLFLNKEAEPDCARMKWSKAYRINTRFRDWKVAARVTPPGDRRNDITSGTESSTSMIRPSYRQRRRYNKKKLHLSLNDITVRTESDETFPWMIHHGDAGRDPVVGGSRSLTDLFGQADKSWVMDRWMWDREDAGKLSGDGEYAQDIQQCVSSESKCTKSVCGELKGMCPTEFSCQDGSGDKPDRKDESQRYSSEDDNLQRYIVEMLKTEIQELSLNICEPVAAEEQMERNRQVRVGDGLESLSRQEHIMSKHLPLREEQTENRHSHKLLSTAEEVQKETLAGDSSDNEWYPTRGHTCHSHKGNHVKRVRFELQRTEDDTERRLETSPNQSAGNNPAPSGLARFPQVEVANEAMMQDTVELYVQEQTAVGALLAAETTVKPICCTTIPLKDDITGTGLFCIHRLPGEPLGMVLNIESSGGEGDPVSAVIVQYVQPGGAVDRASNRTRSIHPGDRIIEINGTCLGEMSYKETVLFFQEMPLQVTMKVGQGDMPKDTAMMNTKTCTGDTSRCRGDDTPRTFESDCELSSEKTQSNMSMHGIAPQEDGETFQAQLAAGKIDEKCSESDICNKNIRQHSEYEEETKSSLSGNGSDQENTVTWEDGQSKQVDVLKEGSDQMVSSADDQSMQLDTATVPDDRPKQMTTVTWVDCYAKQQIDIVHGHDDRSKQMTMIASADGQSKQMGGITVPDDKSKQMTTMTSANDHSEHLNVAVDPRASKQMTTVTWINDLSKQMNKTDDQDNDSEQINQNSCTHKLYDQKISVNCLNNRIKQESTSRRASKQTTQDISNTVVTHAPDESVGWMTDQSHITPVLCDSSCSYTDINQALLHWLQMLYVVVIAQRIYSTYGNIWRDKGTLAAGCERISSQNYSRLTCKERMKSVVWQCNETVIIEYVGLDGKTTTESSQQWNSTRTSDNSCDKGTIEEMESHNEVNVVRTDGTDESFDLGENKTIGEGMHSLEEKKTPSVDSKLVAHALSENKSGQCEGVTKAGKGVYAVVAGPGSIPEMPPAWRPLGHLKTKHRKTFSRIRRRRDAIAGSDSDSDYPNEVESSVEPRTPRGFACLHVHFKKPADKPLGLSIVRSYGSTSAYCQVRRILASGACMACQVGILPGDRLVSLNTTCLHGLSHTACLNVLTQPATNICLTLLRHQPTDQHSDSDTSSTSSDSDTSPELTSDDEQKILDVGDTVQNSGTKQTVIGVTSKKPSDNPFVDINSVFSGNNGVFLEKSTDSVQSSEDHQVSPGGRARSQKVNICEVDGTVGIKYTQKRFSPEVPLTLAHNCEQVSRYGELISADVECDVDLSRGSSKTVSQTTTIGEMPSNTDSSVASWSTVEQEEQALNGNKLFAQHSPFIYPWRRQFDVLECSLVDGDTCCHPERSDTAVTGDDGSDVSSQCEADCDERAVNGEYLIASQRSEGSTVEDLPVTLKDLPVNVEDLPVTLKDLPVNVEDLPVTLKDLPVNVEDLPVNMEDLPVNVEDLPVNMEDLLVNVEDLLVNVEDLPVNVEDLPVNMEDLPVNVEDLPVNVEDLLVNVEDLPVNVEDLPVNMEDLPVNVKDLLVNVEDLPVNVEDLPVNVENQLVSTPVGTSRVSITNTEKTLPMLRQDDTRMYADDTQVQSELASVTNRNDSFSEGVELALKGCNNVTSHLQTQTHDEKDYVNVAHLLTLPEGQAVQTDTSCATSSVYGDSTFDDSCAYSDSWTPGQVYSIPTSAFELLEKQFDSESNYKPLTCHSENVSNALLGGERFTHIDQHHETAEPVDIVPRGGSECPSSALESSSLMADQLTYAPAIPPRSLDDVASVDLLKDPDVPQSVSPMSRDPHLRHQHQQLMQELKMLSQQPAVQLTQPTDHSVCPAAPANDQLQPDTCDSYKCEASIDRTPPRTDNVPVNSAVTPSDNVYQPLDAIRTKHCANLQLTDVRNNTEEHSTDSLSFPHGVAWLTELSGSLNPKLLTKQRCDGQSLCQALSLRHEHLHEEQSSRMIPHCYPSTAGPHTKNQSENIDHATSGDIQVLPRMTTNTAGDSAPNKSRQTVSDVCKTQDAVTTARVMFHPLSHGHQHCNTVKQRPCSVFSPTVMHHRSDHCITTDGDQLTHSLCLSTHEQVLSIKECKTRNCQGDGCVTVPPPKRYLPSPEVSVVPLRQSCFLGHASVEGRGLSLTHSSAIFTHDWQPIAAEECSATTVNRHMTQTSGSTHNSKSVTNNCECTTGTVSPRSRPCVTSVDTVQLKSSIAGLYPGVDPASTASWSRSIDSVTLRTSPQQRDDPKLPRLTGSNDHLSSKSRKLCSHTERGYLPPVIPHGTLPTALTQPRNMLPVSHRASDSGRCGRRTEDKPFHVQILRSLLGIGISIKVTPNGVVITDIHKTGPVAKNGSVRVGDYLLSINGRELRGLNDAEVQNIFRLLPRGIAHLEVSVLPPTGSHEQVGDNSTATEKLTSNDSQTDILETCNPAKLDETVRVTTRELGVDLANVPVKIPTIIGVPSKALRMNGESVSPVESSNKMSSAGSMMRKATTMPENAVSQELPEYTPLRRVPKNATVNFGLNAAQDLISCQESDDSTLFKKPAAVPAGNKQSCMSQPRSYDKPLVGGKGVVLRQKPVLNAQFSHRLSMPVMNVSVTSPRTTQFGKRESVIESLEKKRRESIGTRLKGLQVPVNAQHKNVSTAGSSGPVNMLPTIIGQKTHVGMLPKMAAIQKRHSYQSLVPSTFSTKPLKLQHRMSASFLTSAQEIERQVTSIEDTGETSEVVCMDDPSNADNSVHNEPRHKVVDDNIRDNDVKVFLPCSDKEVINDKERSLTMDDTLNAEDKANMDSTIEQKPLQNELNEKEEHLNGTDDVLSSMSCDKNGDTDFMAQHTDTDNKCLDNNETATVMMEPKMMEDSHEMDSPATSKLPECTLAETNNDTSLLCRNVTVMAQTVCDIVVSDAGDTAITPAASAVSALSPRSKPPLLPKPRKPTIPPKPTKFNILSSVKPEPNKNAGGAGMHEVSLAVKMEEPVPECDKYDLVSSDDTCVREENMLPVDSGVASHVDIVAPDRGLLVESNKIEDVENGSYTLIHSTIQDIVEKENSIKEEENIANKIDIVSEMKPASQLAGKPVDIQHVTELVETNSEVIDPVNAQADSSPSGLYVDTSSVTDMTQPVVPDMTSPVVPDMAPPVVPDMAPPVVLDMAPPVVPDMAPPVVPDMAPPVVPDMAPPVVPDMAPPVVPDMAPPVVPDMAPPVVPDMAPPVVPDMAPPVVPDMAPPVVPDMAPPVVPDMAPPVVPDMAQPVVPDMAPPVVPDMAPIIVPDMAPPVVPDIDTPLVPDLALPVVPDMAPPVVPDMAPQVVPDMALPVVPDMAPLTFSNMATPVILDMAAPLVPAMIQPVVPDMTTPLIPDMATPMVPDMAPPVVSDMATPLIPDIATPMVPDIATSVVPDMAPPMVPDMAPPMIPDMTPVVLDVTPGTIDKEAQDDIPRLVQDETPPLWQDETLPLVQDETQPLVQDKTPPLVQDETLPLVQDETPPLVQDETLPLVQDETLPLMQDDIPPLMQDETLPLVQDETLPLMQDDIPPLVQDETQPLMQDECANVDALITDIGLMPVLDVPDPVNLETSSFMSPQTFQHLLDSDDVSFQLSLPEISIHPPTPTQDLRFNDDNMSDVVSYVDEVREKRAERDEAMTVVTDSDRGEVSSDVSKVDMAASETKASHPLSSSTSHMIDNAVSFPSDADSVPQLPPGLPPSVPPSATCPLPQSDVDLPVMSGSVDLSDMSHFDSELEGNFRTQLPQTSSPMMSSTQKEEMSEGRGSLLSSPDINGPLSPTHSDTDSGIYSSRTGMKCETEFTTPEPKDQTSHETQPSDSLLTETPPRDPPSTVTMQKDPPSTETLPKDPPSTETLPKDPPSTETLPKDPPSTETPPRDPPSTVTMQKDPPSTETMQKDPPSCETQQREPPSSLSQDLPSLVGVLHPGSASDSVLTDPLTREGNDNKIIAPISVDVNSNEKDPSNHLLDGTSNRKSAVREFSPKYERRIKTRENSWMDSTISTSVASCEDTREEIIKEVVMKKGSVGLGFCIEGGTASPLGDRPITVKRLFKGGAAAHGVLQPGDRLIVVNDKDFGNLSHFVAWSFLKAIPEGTIRMTIGRRMDP